MNTKKFLWLLFLFFTIVCSANLIFAALDQHTYDDYQSSKDDESET